MKRENYIIGSSIFGINSVSFIDIQIDKWYQINTRVPCLVLLLLYNIEVGKCFYSTKRDFIYNKMLVIHYTLLSTYLRHHLMAHQVFKQVKLSYYKSILILNDN